MSQRRKNAVVLAGLATAVGLAAGVAVATASAPVVARDRAPSSAPAVTGLPSTAAPTEAVPPVAPTTSSTMPPSQTRLVARLAASIGGTVGCAVAQAPGGPVVAVHPGVSLATASTQKLVVAATALAVLGPGYRFVTRVEAAAPPVNGQVPRLWLVGSGDPTLSTGGYRAQVARTDHYGAPAPFTPLEWLAGAVRAAGVRSVPAGVVGDATLLSQQAYLPTWKPLYLEEDDVGPLSALSLNEGWAQFGPQYAPSPNPAAGAAGDLIGLLHGEGVAVGGIGPDGAVPGGAVTIASVTSAPLSEIVAYMLATSDNHIAELLTRMLGLRVAGDGSTPAGVEAVVSEAASLGIPTAGVHMVDGSGLSPGNRSTCPELLATYRLGSQPRFAGLWSGLPVAGRSGTLYRQWAGTPLAGRVVAKTGWIDDVAAIVGTVTGPHPVQFALAMNGPFNYAQAEARQSQALDALLAYSQS